VSFIEESLGWSVAPCSSISLWHRRHRVELALRGYSVVRYDLSVAMLARAADRRRAHAKLNFLQGHARAGAFEEMFRWHLQLSTTLVLRRRENAALVHRIHRALRPGGMFLLDVLNRAS